jgi:DNA-binding PadR family transcriptional regulator
MIGRTGYLILGLLLEEPLTGYAIKKLTEQRFRFFWNESFGQIYPQLKRLAEEGYVRARRDPAGGRDRIVYALARKGRSALREWLAERRCQDHLRLESVLKIYIGAVAKDTACGLALEEFGAKSAAALVELREMRAELACVDDPRGNHRGILAVMDLGIATYEAWRRWAEESDLAKEA